jgi:N-acylneuraminate cytidylyltransferase
MAGKNYRKIKGVPLVSWSIMFSLLSKYIDLTVVSSNCEVVKKITKNISKNLAYYNCELETLHEKDYFSNKLLFLDRPDEFSTSTSKNEEALLHTLDNMVDKYDIVINLQPTSPIRFDCLIDKCLEKFVKDKADSLFTANKCTPFFFRVINNEVLADWDIHNRPMRQEIIDWVYHDNGNVYIMKSDLLKETKCRLGGKMSIYETDQFQSLQIDSEEDLLIINALDLVGIYGNELERM